MILAFWQLGSAWMLLWGLAAALPLLIHLWSRRKYREQSWAAMTFLLAALRKNSRRIQLEQWILLAVRTLLMILFALALADPQLSVLSNWIGAAAGGQTHFVLVLDGSYSMDFQADDRSRFDAAKELLKDYVRASRQGDGFTLILMGEPPRAIIAQPAFDPQDVLEEIDNLQHPQAGASLAATLAEIETVLRRAGESHPRLTQRRVSIYSDLQHATWDNVELPDVRERWRRLEDLALLELIDLGQPGEENLAVTNLQIDQRLVAVGSQVRIQADVQSFARTDQPRQAVEILVDGQRIADERIDLPAGGRASVAAEHRFDTPGDHVVEVRLADDALPLDNRRWLCVPVKGALRVLAIGGRPGETDHLALALAPRKQAGGQFEIVQASESHLLESDLHQFDCVVLCNIGRFNQDEASVVGRYVRRGGGVIVFLGDQVQQDSYNHLLLDQAETRLLPARLGDLTPAETYSVNPLDYGHPIVAPFRGHESSGLLTTPIWKYVRLTPTPQAKVAAALDSGDPLIVEERIGRGRCILVATAASPASMDHTVDPPTAWTALSTWPSFPPLVHEMVQFSVAGRSEGRNLLVGDELTAEVPAGGLDQPLTLSGPDGLSERIPVVVTSGEARWSFPGALQSGMYESQIGNISQRFAVNVNPRESDLSRFDSDLLPAQLHRNPLEPIVGGPAIAGGDANSYFRWLLAAVLALLFVEPCLAWQFGRGRG